MDKIEELELLIKELDARLAIYLNNPRSSKEIYKLSKELDKLIIKHCNFSK